MEPGARLDRVAVHVPSQQVIPLARTSPKNQRDGYVTSRDYEEPDHAEPILHPILDGFEPQADGLDVNS